MSNALRPARLLTAAAGDEEISGNPARLHLSCCRCKVFKNKGTVLLSFWCFTGLSVLHFIALSDERKRLLSVTKSPLIVFTICLTLYPILGWLADVRCGRYSVIKWSLRVLCAVSVLFCAANVLLISLHSHSLLSHKWLVDGERIVRYVIYAPMTLGVGGLMANIYQFMIDQLIDASSSEISSFLRWCAWVWFLSGVVGGLSQLCINPSYELIGYLLLPLLTTMAVCSDFFFSHWLVKEPSSKNPFILIFSVLRYAIKNKHPRLRSAFTYWEDERYHRIDLAKTKYGGPYTTEQVEDVKTFFRITSVVLAGSFFISMFISVYPVYIKVVNHLHDAHYVECKKGVDCSFSVVRNCFQRMAVRYSGDFIMVVCVPIYEFILHPYFKRRFPFPMLRRMSVAVVLLFLSLGACTAIEFAAQHQRDPLSNMTCPLTVHSQEYTNTLSLDYKWMTISYFIMSAAQFLAFTSVLEFLCAQSPYSMKGLLFGLMYGSVGLFTAIGFSLMQLVQTLTERKLFYRYGCLFWYMVIGLAILLSTFPLYFVVFKCYRKRRRDDNEHNEQTFAENYYTKQYDSIQ